MYIILSFKFWVGILIPSLPMCYARYNLNGFGSLNKTRVARPEKELYLPRYLVRISVKQMAGCSFPGSRPFSPVKAFSEADIDRCQMNRPPCPALLTC